MPEHTNSELRRELGRLSDLFKEATDSQLDFIAGVDALHVGSLRQIVDHIEHCVGITKEEPPAKPRPERLRDNLIAAVRKAGYLGTNIMQRGDADGPFWGANWQGKRMVIWKPEEAEDAEALLAGFRVRRDVIVTPLDKVEYHGIPLPHAQRIVKALCSPQ